MTRPLVYTILPRPPHSTRDGLAIRNFHLLAGLASVFRVRSFVLQAPHLDEEPAEYPEGVVVDSVRQSPRRLRQAVALARAAAGGVYPTGLYASRELLETVRAAARLEEPAWVVAQSYHVARAALEAGPSSWVDFHNVDSEIWQRLGQTAAGAPSRLFARLQAPRVQRFERDVLRLAGGASCVSERDARTLAALGPVAHPLVVPNGVDLSRYCPRRKVTGEQLVLFVGDLTWAPNRNGIRWFQRSVWPEVKRLRPDARAEILGRGGESLGREATDFVFLGAGGDTRPLWRRAAVGVVPLQAGGGTRLKILEAAACGVPVVSTSVGVEGLSLSDGNEILIRDDPKSFAVAVAGLLSDRKAAERLGRAARARVERMYDWKSIGEEFANTLLTRVAERR